MKGTLTKLSTNKNALRTNQVRGEFTLVPTVGKSFLLISEALDPTVKELAESLGAEAGRLIRTSLIKSVQRVGDSYVFDTFNSRYQLDLEGPND